MPITQFQSQFRRPPYQSPLSQQMPQMMMNLLGSYFQNKYATQRQKDQWDKESTFKADQAELDRKFELDQAKATAQLQELKYYAGMRKTHIRLTGPDKFPEDYKQSDVVAGVNNKSWWVKRREKKPIDFYKITKKGVVETKATYTADVDKLKKAGWKRGTITLPTDRETWKEPTFNKKLNAITITSNLGNMKVFGEKGWVATTKEEAMDLRQAGASKMTQIIGESREERAKEEHGFKVGATIAEIRTSLTTGKQDKNLYAAQAPRFNNANKQNEVAYWDSVSFDNKTKIKKLSKRNIDLGWTPIKIQQRAIGGMTVEQVLIEIGEL